VLSPSFASCRDVCSTHRQKVKSGCGEDSPAGGTSAASAGRLAVRSQASPISFCRNAFTFSAEPCKS
jgi:hypothetical protein